MDKIKKTNELPEEPIFRKEYYLNKIATGIEAAGYPDYPISRIEQYLDYIAEHGGGFEPTEEQLAAMNSGITQAIVGRTILTPLTTPTEETLLGVDDTNSEAQFRLGVGLGTDEDTSPYTIDVKGFSYLTVAPTSANIDGDLKVVVLSAEPDTKYDGYLYLIKEA